MSVAAFAVFDLIAGITGAWNGPQPMVEGLPPCAVHVVISTSIDVLDVTIATTALLLMVSSQQGTGQGSARMTSLAHIPWAAALMAATLSWVELWFAATHHPIYVNGGPVASSVFLAYAVWRVPFAREDYIAVRLFGVAVVTTI